MFSQNFPSQYVKNQEFFFFSKIDSGFEEDSF